MSSKAFEGGSSRLVAEGATVGRRASPFHHRGSEGGEEGAKKHKKEIKRRKMEHNF